MDETGYLFFFNNATEIFVLNFFFLLRLHKILGNYQGKINSLCVFIFFFQVFKPIVEKFNFTFNCDIKRR